MTALDLPQPAARISEAADEDQPPARRIRVLIADDQKLEREVLRHLLSAESDIELIRTCVNGVEAVKAIQELSPDLVFLDVEMPELDGFGVVSNLDPAHKPVVVFVTANEEFARKAFDVQALDYLIKPAQRNRLKLALERVRHQLELQRAHERECSRTAAEPGS